MRTMREMLHGGGAVAITPDGPRGPLHHVSTAAPRTSRATTGLPILPFGFGVTRADPPALVGPLRDPAPVQPRPGRDRGADPRRVRTRLGRGPAARSASEAIRRRAARRGDRARSRRAGGGGRLVIRIGPSRLDPPRPRRRSGRPRRDVRDFDPLEFLGRWFGCVEVDVTAHVTAEAGPRRRAGRPPSPIIRVRG